MSDQEKNINEIRNLLRKKLADQRTADGSWNVPSNSVWGGISEELQAEQKASGKIDRQYLLFAIIALFMSMLMMQECSNRKVVGDMKTEMQELKSSFNQLKENCEKQSAKNKSETSNSNFKQKPITNNPGENTSLLLISEKNVAPQKNNISPLSENVTSYSTPAKQQLYEQTPSYLLTTSLALSTVMKNPVIGSKFSNEKTKNVGKISLIPWPIIQMPTNSPEVELTIPKLQNSKNRHSLFTKVYAGLSLTGNRLAGERPGIIFDQKPLIGRKFGVGLEVGLSSKLSFETGLQYSIHQYQTNYQLEVPYTQTDEYLHDDGNYDNHYNHSLPSSMGDYPALFVLTRSNDETVEEGEIMNIDFIIRQRTRFLGVPLRLRYGFGKGNWQAGVKSGIIGNRTLSISSEAKELISHHDAIHQRHTSIGDPIFENLEKITFDYSLGLDARYFITPRLIVSLEGNYQQGITPVFKDENVKNYFRSVDMNVGLQYRF